MEEDTRESTVNNGKQKWTICNLGFQFDCSASQSLTLHRRDTLVFRRVKLDEFLVRHKNLNDTTTDLNPSEST